MQLLPHIVKQQNLKFLKKKRLSKMQKITKRLNAYKGTYNVEILNSFNLKLELKDIGS